MPGMKDCLGDCTHERSLPPVRVDENKTALRHGTVSKS